jgi:hypothetical protein
MRIRFSVSLDIRREHVSTAPELEHKDTETLVEQIGQPVYTGFRVEADRG